MNWFLAFTLLRATSPFHWPSAWRNPSVNWSANGILKSFLMSQISPPACAFFCSSSSAWLAIVRSKERPQPPNTTVLRSLKTSNEAPKRGASAPVKFLRELPVLM